MTAVESRERGRRPERAAARRSALAYLANAGRLAPSLLPRRHQEHAVDLVGRRLVVDPVRDAPDAAEPPLVEVGGVLEEELLGLDVDLGALLLVERRAPLDDQVVERRIAVVAVRLVAPEDVVEDGVGVEDR